MRTQPDHLPLAITSCVGLPYHGIVTGGDPGAELNGTLTLLGSLTRSYPQPLDGSTVAVQHPRAAAITRTADEQASDTAYGRQWLTYALLSGANRQIGGQDLGATYHLYCDANVTWRIRTTVTSGTGQFTVRVYLSGLFGLMPTDGQDYSMSERLLAQETFYPVNYDGSSASTKTVGNRTCRTFSKTGAKAIIQVGTTDNSFPAWKTSLYAQSCTSGLLHDVIRVTLSGNGSVVPGSIGSGISAAISSVYQGDSFYTYVSTGNIWLLPDNREEIWRWGYVTDKDGNETYAEQYYSYFGEQTGDQQEDDGYPIYEEVNQYFSFGGYSYTGLATFVGAKYVFEASSIGVEIINGVSRDVAEGLYDLQFAMSFGGETVLPLVCIAQTDNKDQEIITAEGRHEAWPHYSGDVITHNAFTDEVTHGGSSYICYV